MRADREARLQVLIDQNKLKWALPSPIAKDHDKWDRAVKVLLEFRERFGHMNVPQNYTHNYLNGNSFNLGKWISVQRQKYKLKSLSVERVQQLQRFVDEGYFSWSLPHAYARDDEKFEFCINLLRAFENIHGHCNVPQTFIHTTSEGAEIKLGLWLTTQRQLKRKGILDSEREKVLQSMVDSGKLKWRAFEDIREDKSSKKSKPGPHMSKRNDSNLKSLNYIHASDILHFNINPQNTGTNRGSINQIPGNDIVNNKSQTVNSINSLGNFQTIVPSSSYNQHNYNTEDYLQNQFMFSHQQANGMMLRRPEMSRQNIPDQIINSNNLQTEHQKLLQRFILHENHNHGLFNQQNLSQDSNIFESNYPNKYLDYPTLNSQSLTKSHQDTNPQSIFNEYPHFYNQEISSVPQYSYKKT